jgi:MFS family permease
VPSLSADLEPSSTELLWITDIYGFFLAGFLITMGTLGDRVGRRRLLLIGAAAFGVVSVLAAFSTSVVMLIVRRALLGVAAATLPPSTLSLIRNMFLDPGKRTFAIGVWATSFSVGAALGPLLGGVLLQFFRGKRLRSLLRAARACRGSRSCRCLARGIRNGEGHARRRC